MAPWWTLNAGLREASGEIVAITDDAAAPRHRWLERIESHFRADPEVGGVGGRGWVHGPEGVMTGSEHIVGKVTWYGRLIGAHHLGVGGPREVDVLKGCNMSFRRSALDGVRLDRRLRGEGAQIHNELALSIRVRENGWKLLYDSEVEVDHYPSVRHDKDKRRTYSPEAQYDINYNQALALVRDAPALSGRALRLPGANRLHRGAGHREARADARSP